MGFSKKSRLEEREVKAGEDRLLQRFAADNVAANSQDSLAAALDLVVNRQPNEVVVDNPFLARLPSHFEEIKVNPVISDLRSVNVTLERQWQVFNLYLEQEHKKKIEKYHTSWKRRLFKSVPNDIHPRWRVNTRPGQTLGIEDIKTSVEDAKRYWELKPRRAHGKAQRAFHHFCDTAHSHSNLLKCLPEQSQYLSVFCGATTTLIQASVNHQKTAEIFSQALSDITEPLKDCEDEVEIVKTGDMHEAISSLYTHVFHFLYSAMKWYQQCTSKRILNSLTENSSDVFKEQVEKIQELCRRLLRKGMIKTQAKLHRLCLRIEDGAAKDGAAKAEAAKAEAVQAVAAKAEAAKGEAAKAEAAKAEAAKAEAVQAVAAKGEAAMAEAAKNEIHEICLRIEDEAAKNELARQQDREKPREQGASKAQMEALSEALGNQMVSVCRANVQAWLHTDEETVQADHSPAFSIRKLTEQGEDTGRTKRINRQREGAKITTRSELQQWSAALEDFTSNISELLDSFDLPTTLAGFDIVEAIRNWGRSPTSQSLWILGRFQENYPSDATAIAAKVIATVRDMSIPFVCYFFSVDEEINEDSRPMIAAPYQSPEEAMAIDFVYTLIRQLIDQLPYRIKLQDRKLKTRLGQLDGSMDTIHIALKILKELLDHAPATLLVIIDGLGLVDESDAQPTILKVLRLLQDVTIQPSPGKVTKILYTTAGTSNALDSLDEDYLECIEAVNGRPKHMRGRLTSLDDLSFDSDATTISSNEASTDDEYD